MLAELSAWELLGCFVAGIILGIALVLYVNFLVDRRLRFLLRRAAEQAEEEEDWPAPPM